MAVRGLGPPQADVDGVAFGHSPKSSRLSRKERTLAPHMTNQATLAHVEGWIHLPKPDSLAELAPD
jgi:hypothetical protein